MDSNSLVDQIRALAVYDSKNTAGEIQLTKYLVSWWSDTYGRPFKDPLLKEYTLEELLYEYSIKVERDNASADNELQKEIDKEEAAEAWADEMEALEEAERAKKEAAKQGVSKDDVDWMNKIIQEDKAKYGEDFGDDLSIDFNE